MPVISYGSGNSLQQVRIDRDPDFCPICFRHIKPQDMSFAAKWEQNLERILRCPATSCLRLFIARYIYRHPDYELFECVPRSKPQAALPKLVSEKYPPFVDIYSQSLHAESMGLAEICGAGYRRSLEFLIKTYLLDKTPDEKVQAEIRRTMLGACIGKFVSEGSLKSVAERATWLGNDETHFERRWEGKDLQDLKQLVELTASWIETELRTAAAIASMPDPSKKVAHSSPTS
jgi:hypothetical protein